KNAKGVCNWLLGDVSGWLNHHEQNIETCALKPENLAKLVQMVDDGKINGKQAKALVEDLMEGKDPAQAAKDRGMEQVSDEGALREMVLSVLAANPQAVEDYRAGKDRAVGFLVGQMMKASRGKANPSIVNALIVEELKKLQ
ncbi:MAG: Asp-tRNA(Asn)/Glu-tRNA(Gln) amidotransferase GatCAB subunit B, partial [Solobacterium sp.]|nr:Asp-tRNA(Asn)/Glu-tRNA(Gln) amidotransferase GatCAB subunit B [Solobacterium sp.]